MRYFSTRGGDETLSFEETVLTGLAPNGGLYIPTNIPALPENWQTAWAKHSFQELSFEVLSLFVSADEIPPADLRALIARSYSTFRHPDITPVHPLGEREFVLELWHGPTFAFKDVALQLLGNLFEYFLARRNARGAKERLTVVGATSGDTGSAAIYGLRNKENVSIFILHPKGRVSPIQEAQMTTVTDPNVHNLAVQGTFDDCQDIVKELFSDREFNAKHRLGAVNSINWARILAQTVYYFLAYFHVRRHLPSSLSSAELQFVVPTGNFGDVLAGWYAKRMGLPMARLAVATNENDILARFWASGAYEAVPSAPDGPAAPAQGASDGAQARGTVKETLSPAMDIMVSSNFERLLWYLAFEDPSPENQALDEAERHRVAGETVRRWMGLVKADGRVQVSRAVVESARKEFVAERVSNELTLETIRDYYNREAPYVADPHTAVGLAAARIVARTNPPSTIQVTLSTAHPAKFSEAVTRALAGEPGFHFDAQVLPEELKGLLAKERRVVNVERPDAALVKEVIERYVDDGSVGASV